MGGDDFTDFAEGYYPVFDRQGLIIDVRHNRGGNIDSWILSRLLRKVWFYWTQPVGKSPTWNMQWPSAATWSCSATSARARTARPSPRASGGSAWAR